MRHAQGIDPPVVYLHPGEICISENPTKVITVLGSCVSVTMFNLRLRTGAICHATLPQCKSMGKCDRVCTEAFKFMDCALKYMLMNFGERGILAEEIELKIFGGADTMMSKSRNTVGSKNVKSALTIIREKQLRIVAADVGDSFGRKLIFLSHTGEVFLKRLKNGQNPRPRT